MATGQTTAIESHFGGDTVWARRLDAGEISLGEHERSLIIDDTKDLFDQWFGSSDENATRQQNAAPNEEELDLDALGLDDIADAGHEDDLLGPGSPRVKVLPRLQELPEGKYRYADETVLRPLSLVPLEPPPESEWSEWADHTVQSIPVLDEPAIPKLPLPVGPSFPTHPEVKPLSQVHDQHEALQPVSMNPYAPREFLPDDEGPLSKVHINATRFLHKPGREFKDAVDLNNDAEADGVVSDLRYDGNLTFLPKLHTEAAASAGATTEHYTAAVVHDDVPPTCCGAEWLDDVVLLDPSIALL